MSDEIRDWAAPDVTPITEADGESTHPTARIRNGGNGNGSPV